MMSNSFSGMEAQTERPFNYTLENGCKIIGLVRVPGAEDGFIVLAEERGPAGIVCWMADVYGNCFWGRYGSEAIPAFHERLNRYFR